MNDFVDRLITLFESYLVVSGSVFRIRLMLALYFEFDVLLLLIRISSRLYCLQRRPAKPFEFCDWNMMSFLSSMLHFLGEVVGGGGGIDSGSVSWWFLEVLCCSLFESLCSSLVTFDVRICICSCISLYFI